MRTKHAAATRRTIVIAEETLSLVSPPDSVRRRRVEFNALREQAQQHAEDVRLLELQRFDGMTEALWPDVQKGEARSVMAAVRVSERRARLLGIDAPVQTKTEHTVGMSKAHLEEISKCLSDEELKLAHALGMQLKALLATAEERYQALPPRRVVGTYRRAQ